MGKFSIHSLMTRGNNIVMLCCITVATFALMSCLAPRFLTERNMVSMSFLFPELGILALAMMLAMLTGGIDLSLVGTANLSSILVGFVMVRLAPRGTPPEKAIPVIAMAVALALVIGAVCGLLNGFIIARFRVPPILATLGTMQLFTGIAMVLTKGTAVIGFPGQYSRIGNGSIGGYVSYPLILFLALLAVFYVMQKRSYLGIKFYLVGSNAKAADFAGINVPRTLMTSYLMSGVLAALAGIIMSSRTNAAKADFGSSYTLQAILVAVLGGINPNGGSGNVMGILMAVLSLQFLSSGFTMLRFSNFTKDFVWGAFLLAIMIVNYFLYERKKTT